LKVVYFDWHSEATEFYRLMPFDYISVPGIEITRSAERTITSHLLNGFDVIILSRPTSEYQLNIINLAKDLHKVVISDFDDDVLNVPVTNPNYKFYHSDRENICDCLSFSDEVWVTTESIKNSFGFYNKNIHLIPNAHDDIVFPVKDKKPFSEKNSVMWRGGQSHILDIYQPGTAEWIVELINNNKEWQFYWLGQKFEWIEYRIKHGNFFYNPGASCIQFYKIMHDINPAIFFYPLTNNLFNNGKSNCSIIESSYSGSAYFGNTSLSEFNLPGVKSLSELPYLLKGNHADELENMNKETWDYVQSELLVTHINKKRLDRLLNFC